MSNIQAPYRFVPLSNIIVFPEWATQVSHDKPFKDGICGELNIEIRALSELCIGGEQIPSTEHSAGIVKFFKTPDGNPAIPASSLKGMLRNVFEIASFSRFKQVDDQKLGVRDISQADNFYAKAMKGAKSGWLRFEDNQWKIIPCSHLRVHQQSIIDYFGIDKSDWINLKTVRQRYGKLGITPVVSYDHYDHLDNVRKNGKEVATLNKNAMEKRALVVTGQPGSDFTKKSGKKYEFLFAFPDEKTTALSVSPEVMNGFRQIHNDTDEWKFWLAKIQQLEYGIPVFYHSNGQEVNSLGLAMMYKLPYKHNIHSAIKHTTEQHIDAIAADFADVLFGRIEENDSLRGRINIGLGFPAQDYSQDLDETSETILNSPKATYYPLYVRQTSHSEFNQLMQDKAELSGWKRYVPKPVEILPPTDKSTYKVQVRLETLPENTRFNSKIRFHNLKPVELGALLWVLDFGGRSELRHQIGMGKPYGLGQIKLTYLSQNSKLRRNDQQVIEDNELFLRACRQEFVDYMDRIFQTAVQTNWQDTDVMKALFDYAKYDDKSRNLDYLSTPKEYAELRNTDNLDEFIDIFHHYNFVKADKSISLDFSYQNNLTQNIEQAKYSLEQEIQKEKLAQQKQNATEEERVLIELEEFLNKSKEGVTKTLKKNAGKLFDRVKDAMSQLNDEQKQQAKLLTNQLFEALDDKSLRSRVKAIQEYEG